MWLMSEMLARAGSVECGKGQSQSFLGFVLSASLPEMSEAGCICVLRMFSHSPDLHGNP